MGRPRLEPTTTIRLHLPFADWLRKEAQTLNLPIHTAIEQLIRGFAGKSPWSPQPSSPKNKTRNGKKLKLKPKGKAKK